MAATNLFSANQADVETDISGFYAEGTQGSGQGPFTNLGVTVLRDGAQALHGFTSLNCSFDGGATFQFLEVRVPVAGGSFVAGGQYTWSAYLYSVAGGPTLRYYCQADTGNIGTVGNITLLAGWNRYFFTVTLPNPITQQYFSLRLDTGSTAQAVQLWLDMLQVNPAPLAPWVPGIGTSAVVANTDPITSGLTLLGTVLGGDATFMGLVTGVFQDIAPETSAGVPQAPDYAIISVQSPEPDTLGAAATRILSRATFMVKIVGPTSDMANLHAAYNRADALLKLIRNDPATGILACYRVAPFGLAEPKLVNGKPWYNLGGLYKMEM